MTAHVTTCALVRYFYGHYLIKGCKLNHFHLILDYECFIRIMITGICDDETTQSVSQSVTCSLVQEGWCRLGHALLGQHGLPQSWRVQGELWEAPREVWREILGSLGWTLDRTCWEVAVGRRTHTNRPTHKVRHLEVFCLQFFILIIEPFLHQYS